MSENPYPKGPFAWAMQEVAAGKAVVRSLWPASDHLIIRSGLDIVGNGDVEHYHVFPNDITATDWELYEESKPEPEHHDVLWAMEQLKAGRAVKRRGWILTGRLNRLLGWTLEIHDICATDWELVEVEK